MEVFWRTIGYYNASTWLWQIGIVLVGIILTWRLYRDPGKGIRRAMKLYLAFLDGWIAIAYYLVACTERVYNQMLAVFWGVMALFWIYDLIVDYTPMERRPKYNNLSYFLYTMPFVYPLFSLVRGLHFPEITSPVMPCSVAVFTIGLLLSFSKKVNIFIVLFLANWALIGFSKVYFYELPEDLLLASASVPALYLFFREYIRDNLHKDTSPRARLKNLLLFIACITIGVCFTCLLFHEWLKTS